MLLQAPDRSSCRALILAAGQGRRLGLQAPKALLTFGGRTLLARHLDNLARCGVRDVAITTGFRAEAIAAEVGALKERCQVTLIVNPAFRDGSVVSLWCAREVLRGGSAVILMDADVLCDRRLLERLLASRHESCFLLDRAIEPGDEPVKLCIAGDRIVDFAKQPTRPHDWHDANHSESFPPNQV